MEITDDANDFALLDSLDASQLEEQVDISRKEQLKGNPQSLVPGYRKGRPVCSICHNWKYIEDVEIRNLSAKQRQEFIHECSEEPCTNYSNCPTKWLNKHAIAKEKLKQLKKQNKVAAKEKEKQEKKSTKVVCKKEDMKRAKKRKQEALQELNDKYKQVLADKELSKVDVTDAEEFSVKLQTFKNLFGVKSVPSQKAEAHLELAAPEKDVFTAKQEISLTESQEIAKEETALEEMEIQIAHLTEESNRQLLQERKNKRAKREDIYGPIFAQLTQTGLSPEEFVQFIQHKINK